MRSNAYGNPFPSRDLKVGLIGSHCVGKTTAGTLLAQWTGFPLLAEGVRDIVHLMGYQQIADVPDHALMQWNILRHQINQEAAATRLQEVQGAPDVAFITDRTTLDNAAYFELYQQGKISDSEFESYMCRALEHAAVTYTHLIYFPILWDHIEPDGFRDTDPEGRRKVDEIVQRLTKDYRFSGSVYTVDADGVARSTEERCTAIMKHLNLWPLLRERNLVAKERTA